MAEFKLNISLSVQVREEAHGVRHGFFSGDGMEKHLEGYEYGSDGQIKAKLKKRAEAQITEALLDQSQRRGVVVGCGDGTVFVVFFRGGQWHVGIYGKDRVHGGYTVGGKDFDSVVENTRKHAADVFGGVIWETRL